MYFGAATGAGGRPEDNMASGEGTPPTPPPPLPPTSPAVELTVAAVVRVALCAGGAISDDDDEGAAEVEGRGASAEGVCDDDELLPSPVAAFGVAAAN